MSANALSRVDTLSYVMSAKVGRTRDSVPARYRNAFAGFLKRLVGDGMTQRELEEKLGISQSHLSQLMQGAKSSRGLGLPVLIRMHEKLGASIDDMLGVRTEIESRLARLEAAMVDKDKETPPPATTVRARRSRSS